MITRLIVALILVISSLGAAAADEPLAFKGLALGSTQEEVLKHYPKADCGIKTICFMTARDIETMKEMAIGGIPVPSMMFSFYEGKLERISIWPRSVHFERLSEALKDRYGVPESDLSSPVRTKAGVEFQNRVLVWRQAGGMVRLERYSSKITDSSLSYSSHESIERQNKEFEEGKRRAIKDL